MVEAIQIYGMDIMYLPRDLQNEDLLFGEDVLAKFDRYFEMEMYVKVYDRFGGEGDFLSKFGMQVEDTMTLVVAVTVFETATNGEFPYPREGDLIYFPFNKAMFEIKFVEDEPTFYQLGKQYIYELRCEMFRYSQEKIETGEPEIDSEYINKLVYSVDVQLGSGTGTYVAEEYVYQGASLATSVASAQVIAWDGGTKILQVKNTVGEFSSTGGNIIGETSAANYAFASVDLMDAKNEKRADNVNLETEAQIIVDFSDTNPFGEY